MPAPPTEQVDVQALLERLRDELRWGANGSQLSTRARARSAAEQFWAVTAERPPHGSPPVQFLKKVLRKAMRWYVEPLAQQQRSFNDATLKLIDALFEELDRVSADRDTRGKLIAELEERLLRLERRPAGSQQTVAAQPAAAALPDYFAFESRMRGPIELVRERQRPYVDDLRDHAPVLDVGCGRGELVALLRDAGVEAQRSRRRRRHGRVRARRRASTSSRRTCSPTSRRNPTRASARSSRGRSSSTCRRRRSSASSSSRARSSAAAAS